MIDPAFIHYFSSKSPLYHSTINGNLTTDNLTSSYIWTSFNLQQSQYHIFDGNCGRYHNDTLDYNGAWPYTYRLTANRDLTLLPLFLREGIYYVSNEIKSKQMLMSRFFNENGISMDLDETDKTPPEHCKEKDFTGNCNSKILTLINKLNVNINLKLKKMQSESDSDANLIQYDGYICFNDQNEIALLNPQHLIVKIERSHLENIYDFTGKRQRGIVISFAISAFTRDTYLKVLDKLCPKYIKSYQVTGDPIIDYTNYKNFILADPSDVLSGLCEENNLTEDEIEKLNNEFQISYREFNTNDIVDLRQFMLTNFGTNGLTNLFFNYICNRSLVSYINYKMTLVDKYKLQYSEFQ